MSSAVQPYALKIKSVKKSQQKIEDEWIRTGIRTLEAEKETWQKNNNIEAQQNVAGSYKKRVYHISQY